MSLTNKDSVPEKLPLRRATFNRKVTIFGAGPVGSACANAILVQGLASEVCLMDKDNAIVSGEVMDLQHATCFLNNAKVIGGTDFSLTQGSNIIIIAAGVHPTKKESKNDLCIHNISLLQEIVPKLSEHNKNHILLVLSSPADILAYQAWKLSGLPKNKVFGIGTSLDTARFAFFLSERLGVAPTECKGWILGEQGEFSVPAWSILTVGGIRLRDIYPKMGKSDDRDDWEKVHRQVVGANYDIYETKGYSSWSLAICVTTIIHDIFNNTGCIRSVATSGMGHYGIDKNVFLSLPCVVTSDGITNVVKLPLDEDETSKIQETAKILYKRMGQHKL